MFYRFSIQVSIVLSLLFIVGCGQDFESESDANLGQDTSGNTDTGTGEDGATTEEPAPGTDTGIGDPRPPIGDGRTSEGILYRDRPWPIIVQEIMSLRATQVMAIRVQTTAAGETGRIITNYTTGATATRLIAMSTQPGVFDVDKRCTTNGLEHTTLSWTQGPDTGARTGCPIPANSTVYINIKLTNCEAGQTCRFYFMGSK